MMPEAKKTPDHEEPPSPWELLRDKLVVAVLTSGSRGCKALLSYNCRGLLALERCASKSNFVERGFVLHKLVRTKQIYTNNCQIAVLDSLQAAIFYRKYKFRRFEYIFCNINISMAIALPFLLLHVLTGKISFAGLVNLQMEGAEAKYLLVRNRQKNKDQRRQYLPANQTIIEGLASISDVSLVTLRNHEAIRDGKHEYDVDTLIPSEQIPEVLRRLGRQIGTRPIDIYSDDGSLGFNFGGAAYYAPTVARKIILSSNLEGSGLRLPDATWRYLSYAYHVAFHGKMLPSALAEVLSPSVFKSSHHYQELCRLAEEAGKPKPESALDLFKDLSDAKALPSRDLIWFYAKNDAFLRRWLSLKNMPPPGLATFFVRDFGHSAQVIELVRKRLGEAFIIVYESEIIGDQRREILSNVRGGNWQDRNILGGIAPPVHWFVIWDPRPKIPGVFARRKWPHLDNSRILVKEELRRDLSHVFGKVLRVVHSSDNSAEAISHLDCIKFPQRQFLIDELISRGIPEACFVDVANVAHR